MKQQHIKRADGRQVTVVEREPRELSSDDRLAALEAWRLGMEARQQDIERRLAALEKRKNPA